MFASRMTTVSNAPTRSRSGTMRSNGRYRLYHLSWLVCSAALRAAAHKFSPLKPLMPKVLEQHFGHLSLGRRPFPIRLADRHVNLEHERAVQVVHQLHEIIARFRNEVRVLLGAELAAGNVQLAALIERGTQQRRRIGILAAGHRGATHERGKPRA